MPQVVSPLSPAREGDSTRYTTYSLGAVLGWRFFVWRGLYAGLYLRYWLTLGSTVASRAVVLSSPQGGVLHKPHAFNFYPNLSIGFAFDL
jgi:hypothetical protein